MHENKASVGCTTTKIGYVYIIFKSPQPVKTMVVLGDGGHRSTVNKDGCQEFISCGTYIPCLDTAWTMDTPTWFLESKGKWVCLCGWGYSRRGISSTADEFLASIFVNRTAVTTVAKYYQWSYFLSHGLRWWLYNRHYLFTLTVSKLCKLFYHMILSWPMRLCKIHEFSKAGVDFVKLFA